MNYTEKYHLPQWEKTDRIMMDDFNRMCADVEEGLRETAAAAASALSVGGPPPPAPPLPMRHYFLRIDFPDRLPSLLDKEAPVCYTHRRITREAGGGGTA